MIVQVVAEFLVEFLEENAEPTIRNRGWEILRRELIEPQKMDWNLQEIFFRAQGTRTYEVIFSWDIKDDPIIDLYCDCPFEGFCKHEAAAIYLLCQRPQVFPYLYNSLAYSLEGEDAELAIESELDQYSELELVPEDESEFEFELPPELEEQARQAMQNYGLPSEAPWQDYFYWEILEYGGYQLQLRKDYRTLVDPDQLNQDLLSQLTQSDPAWELPVENQLKDEFYFGYYWVFHPDQAYTLNPMVGAAAQISEPFKKKIKPLEDAPPLQEVHRLPGDEALLHLSRFFRQLNLKINNEETQARRMEAIHRHLALLEDHPRIYLYQGNPYNHRPQRKDLQLIRFIGHSPPLKVCFQEHDLFVYIKPYVWIEKEWQPLQSTDLGQYNPHFYCHGTTVYFHSSHRQVKLFEVFNREQKLFCARDKFPRFVETMWSDLAPFCELDFSGLSSFTLEAEDLQVVQKELYLTEIGGFIVFRPMVLYEGDKRVEVLAPGDTLEASGDVLHLGQRPKEWEAQFVEELRALHPDFQDQRRPDFFYLRRRQLLEDNWFLKVFPQMLESEIAVYGWKGLTDLKVNPHPAKVSYRVDHKTDWFETEVNIAFGDTEVSLDQLKKNLRPDGYLRLSDGSLGLLPEEWVQRLQKMMEHGEVDQNQIRVSDKLFNLVDQLFEEVNDQEAATFIAEKKKKLLDFDHIHRQPLPESIQATLRHYQEDGFHWLCFLHEFQWGGILADDMGLGKTLQVITFLSHVLKENSQTNLIIVPTSLLFNWENELQKFAPHLKCYFHHGKDRLTDAEQFDAYDLVFTSYGLLTRDLELLRQYSFNYIVLDESQAIKNPASQRYKAARLLQGRNRLALTGTPVENHTFDLYAQLSFLNPGLLGTAASFKKNYAQPIDKQGNEQLATQLQNMIRPFVLRRTKEQVASELPDKVEDVLYCEMKPAQRKVYDAFRNRYRDQLLNKIEEEGMDKARFSVLEGLTKLRQICDTPKILSGDESYDSPSTKIDQLLQHIREKTGQHKILVFSQFVRMLRLIEGELQQAGLSYEYLDGQSSLSQRQESVHNFQENEQCRIFLISLKAGGTGLNLVAADYVYLVDPWWNPAVENQAIDRCYRIGQDKKVIAYRMICKDTVEEKILQLQERKKALASDLVQTDENVLQQLDKATIQSLFQ